MTTEKEIRNRKRCLTCEYYGMNVCPLMANADVFKLDICILDIMKKKKYTLNSPEMFMFKNEPLLLLQWWSFQRENKIPNIGTKVVVLRQGCGGPTGVVRTVVGIKENYIEITDGQQMYIIYKERWYKDLFCLDKYN